MNGTLGSRLGGFLAHFEQSMMEDGCSDETLARIHRISEVYRNLAGAGLGGFENDFQAGYDQAKKSIVEELDSPPLDLGENFRRPENS